MTENNGSAVNGAAENNIDEDILSGAVQTGDDPSENSAEEKVQSEQPEQKAEPKPPGPFGHGGVYRLREKKKFYEVTAEDDISYQGYLSYRHLKMIAWALIVLACLGNALSMYASASKQTDSYSTIVSILEMGKELSVPLLLIASFATILNGRGQYKRVIMTNAAIAVAFAGFFFLVYERFIARGGIALLGSRAEFDNSVRQLLNKPGSTGYFSFNIFIDLTMCTLVMFFVNYNPKTHFQGKLIYLFRGFVLLPVAYEIGCICLKILAASGAMEMPVYLFPFLTTKPPVSFLLFLLVARYFKAIEQKFIRHGKTHEDYEAYLRTNHNSFKFSRFLIYATIFCVIIDVILLIGLSVAHSFAVGATDDNSIMEAFETIHKLGFGGTIELLAITPIMFLFSYTKTHKNKKIDLLIPLAGVAMIAVIYIEGIFSTICELIKNDL